MKYLALSWLLLLSAAANATEKEHMALALQFHALNNTVSKASLADTLIPEIVKSYPSLENHRDRLRLFLVEALESEEYANEVARAYTAVFSEDELVQLIALAQSPGYRILQEKRNVMAVGLVLATTSMARRKLPEFQKSVESGGKDP
jgi:hypothetical protein